jgi:hypothetical protein
MAADNIAAPIIVPKKDLIRSNDAACVGWLPGAFRLSDTF